MLQMQVSEYTTYPDLSEKRILLVQAEICIMHLISFRRGWVQVLKHCYYHLPVLSVFLLVPQPSKLGLST